MTEPTVSDQNMTDTKGTSFDVEDIGDPRHSIPRPHFASQCPNHCGTDLAVQQEPDDTLVWFCSSCRSYFMSNGPSTFVPVNYTIRVDKNGFASITHRPCGWSDTCDSAFEASNRIEAHREECDASGTSKEVPFVSGPLKSLSPRYVAWLVEEGRWSVAQCTCGWSSSKRHVSGLKALDDAGEHQRKEHGYIMLTYTEGFGTNRTLRLTAEGLVIRPPQSVKTKESSLRVGQDPPGQTTSSEKRKRGRGGKRNTGRA
jgi:hypothetical protein